MKPIYKNVLIPISVPIQNYCLNNKIGCVHCESLFNLYICDMGFNLNIDKDGNVPKPKGCKNLQTE